MAHICAVDLRLTTGSAPASRVAETLCHLLQAAAVRVRLDQLYAVRKEKFRLRLRLRLPGH